MMNVLGLSLLLASLAAAGIFSPNPSADQKQRASTIVKEGHRVVVVEYDQGGHQNTKISISPENEHVIDSTKEAASVLPNLGQGISQKDMFMHAHNPKEVICDAYGKCKDKIADAMEKTKDVAQEAMYKKKDVADAIGNVHEYTRDTVETAKNHMARNVSEIKDVLKRSIGIGSMDMGTLMGVANLLGFATAYGMCVWVTFISSYVQSRSMTRQQFAVVQSKIYPVYFRSMAYSIALALFSHVFAHSNTLQAYNLLASLLTLLLNSLYLEPRATKLMLERIKIEKEEGRGREDVSGVPKEDAVRSRIIKLNDKLKKFNSYSSSLNILNLMSLTWHLVYLARRLHHTC